jgi:hypothetical protein
MEQRNFRKKNRYWIILNYLSLTAVLVFFYSGKLLQWPHLIIILEIGSLVIYIISFIRTFIRTKYWKMVHTSLKNLDEREIQVVLNGLKYSYSIFAIVCLIIIYIFAFIEYHPIDILFAGALLLLAHTLPAAVVGWNEKYSSGDEK